MDQGEINSHLLDTQRYLLDQVQELHGRHQAAFAVLDGLLRYFAATPGFAPAVPCSFLDVSTLTEVRKPANLVSWLNFGMTLQDRLEEIMRVRSWDRTDLLRHSGMSNSVVSQWLGKGNKLIKTCRMDAAERLEAASGYAALWISRGEGPRHASPATTTGAAVAQEKMAPYALDSSMEAGGARHGPVPVISWVQAGTWHEIAPTDPEAWLWAAKPVGPRAFALRVRGDSMTAPFGLSYREGSIIFVDPDRVSPSNGDRIVAKLTSSNEATFKVYKNEDGRTWLAPLNTATHQPIYDPFDVIGTVIGQWND